MANTNKNRGNCEKLRQELNDAKKKLHTIRTEEAKILREFDEIFKTIYKRHKANRGADAAPLKEKLKKIGEKLRKATSKDKSASKRVCDFFCYSRSGSITWLETRQ